MTETKNTPRTTRSQPSQAKTPLGREKNPVAKRADVLPPIPWDLVQWDAHDASAAKSMFRFGADAAEQERFIRWLYYASRWGTVPTVPEGAGLSHDAAIFIMGGQHVMKQILDMVNYRPPAQAAGNTEQGN